MTSLLRRCGPLVFVTASVWASTVGAINLDVTPGRMEAALVARGLRPNARRFTGIHARGRSLSGFEVVTEFAVSCRWPKRIAIRDHMFAATTRSVQERSPWHRRVSLVAASILRRMRAMAPLVDVVLQSPSETPRLENRSESLDCRQAPGSNFPLGVVAEAVFDAAVGQVLCTVSVR